MASKPPKHPRVSSNIAVERRPSAPLPVRPLSSCVERPSSGSTAVGTRSQPPETVLQGRAPSKTQLHEMKPPAQTPTSALKPTKKKPTSTQVFAEGMSCVQTVDMGLAVRSAICVGREVWTVDWAGNTTIRERDNAAQVTSTIETNRFVWCMLHIAPGVMWMGQEAQGISLLVHTNQNQSRPRQ